MRVLLSDADVLFLDESTSNLDEETKELIFNLILIDVVLNEFKGKI